MKVLRTIRFDVSDDHVFVNPAEAGELAVSGAFAFAGIDAQDISGKTRQAFANGWLGAETFGRVTLVAVTPIGEEELERITGQLSVHFVEIYGAPSIDAARAVAREEFHFMSELCADHDDNTLLTLQRELTAAGVKESFRSIAAAPADLTQFATHGSLESD